MSQPESTTSTASSITRSLTTYLVGGAVRDKLLHQTIVDRDWLVVGSNTKEMLSLGFTQVGKDFPVFLHPKTKEEYALARTEKKQGQGYTGFICDANEHITLEEDLLRRDLTINALAMSDDGTISDPYGGQSDLNNRILRHVSSAFIEDPLRVLRVARFAARFHQFQFTVADETLTLMKKISNSNELQTLPGERIWQEMHKSLTEEHPEVFFKVLQQCDALQNIWPELACLWTKTRTDDADTNGAGIYALSVLQQAVTLSKKTSIRFAALCQNTGQNLDHNSGARLIEKVCQQFKVPKEHKQLAIKVFLYHSACHQALTLSASKIIDLFNQLDVWRKPEEFNDFLIACQADFQATTGNESKEYLPAKYLKSALAAVIKINAKEFIENGIKGAGIKEAINNKRIEVIKKVTLPLASA
jgi:tRNA nucleotidyltransferase (CCA-adding enzyme)